MGAIQASELEIERRFLVASGEWRAQAAPGVQIRQGYLARGDTGVVRVRIADDHSFLTVKSANRGLTRTEFEYAIPTADAEQMLAMCVEPPIEKVRYVVQLEASRWEVDEFAGSNAGLVMAELELEREDEEFVHPSWLGSDVSHLVRYANSNLARHPYSQWTSTERRAR